MITFESMVAWRFLKESRSQTILILMGITIGVAVQIFLSSLIGGLQENLIAQTVGDAPHIFLEARDNVPVSILGHREDQSGVVVLSRVGTAEDESFILSWQPIQRWLDGYEDLTVASPIVEGSGFVLRGDINRPIVVKGVEYPRADQIYKISNRLIDGRPVLGGNGIIIGRGLAEDLQLSPGDLLEINIASGPSATFTVNGIFDFQNQMLNNSWVFMDLARSQALFDLAGALSRIEMQIPEVFQSEGIAEQIRRQFPEYRVETWQTRNRQLLSALQSQSASSYMIQFFVLLAVTLGIASVLAISAVQKSKEIGILKAIGTRTPSAGRIFLLQGAILGFTGSLSGSLVGTGLIKLFETASRSAGGAIGFEIRVEFSSILTYVIISTVASTFAAIYPARKAAKLTPIEVIRAG